MRTETLHNTLVFVGDIEKSRLEALQLAAQEVNGKGFELCLDKAHYWGHNHIVYAAPSGVPKQLVNLVEALEQRFAAHGFNFDQRKYKPHITLLRKAKWTDAPLPEMKPVRWQVGDFALVQSTQQEGVANYRVLVRFPLFPSGLPSDG